MSHPVAEFAPLALSTLVPGTGYTRPYFSAPAPVTIESYALEVLTDFRFVAAGVIRAEVDIEAATQKMIARGMRSLLVVGPSDEVVGIVTSRDLIGDRPYEAMRSRGVPFAEVRVREVMTDAAHLEVLQLEDVLHARVGDIVETLKHSGRQHALVVEQDAVSDMPTVRGIFSASQIARQLGIVLQQHELSQTFSEIDRAVSERLRGAAPA